jgi:hypothetical protein
MNIPFLDRWRRSRPTDGSEGIAAALVADPQGVGELFSDCELLRSQAAVMGVDLDDSAVSLAALDQLLPRWRDDSETLPRLGNDAGLYLGSVIVRTVHGATWRVRPSGHPVVRLVSGREIHVVEAGLDWAVNGSPELYRVYAEAAEA